MTSLGKLGTSKWHRLLSDVERSDSHLGNRSLSEPNLNDCTSPVHPPGKLQCKSNRNWNILLDGNATISSGRWGNIYQDWLIVWARKYPTKIVPEQQPASQSSETVIVQNVMSPPPRLQTKQKWLEWYTLISVFYFQNSSFGPSPRHHYGTHLNFPRMASYQFGQGYGILHGPKPRSPIGSTAFCRAYNDYKCCTRAHIYIIACKSICGYASAWHIHSEVTPIICHIPIKLCNDLAYIPVINDNKYSVPSANCCADKVVRSSQSSHNHQLPSWELLQLSNTLEDSLVKSHPVFRILVVNGNDFPHLFYISLQKMELIWKWNWSSTCLKE